MIGQTGHGVVRLLGLPVRACRLTLLPHLNRRFHARRLRGRAQITVFKGAPGRIVRILHGLLDRTPFDQRVHGDSPVPAQDDRTQHQIAHVSGRGVGHSPYRGSRPVIRVGPAHDHVCGERAAIFVDPQLGDLYVPRSRIHPGHDGLCPGTAQQVHYPYGKGLDDPLTNPQDPERGWALTIDRAAKHPGDQNQSLVRRIHTVFTRVPGKGHGGTGQDKQTGESSRRWTRLQNIYIPQQTGIQVETCDMFLLEVVEVARGTGVKEERKVAIVEAVQGEVKIRSDRVCVLGPLSAVRFGHGRGTILTVARCHKPMITTGPVATVSRTISCLGKRRF